MLWYRNRGTYETGRPSRRRERARCAVAASPRASLLDKAAKSTDSEITVKDIESGKRTWEARHRSRSSLREAAIRQIAARYSQS